MKSKLLVLLLSLLCPFIMIAQEAEKTLDEKINDWFEPITQFIVSVVFVPFTFGSGESAVQVPIVLVWLVGGAVFATLYFKFINFTDFKTAIDVVRGKYDDIDEDFRKPVTSDTVHTVDGDIVGTIDVEGQQGEVTHFQALTAALSGTVGLGNIAGVAIAISIGGPGATLWMIIAGLLGMSTKFLECTLGVKYRTVDETGKVYGGPMYYLSQGFKDMKMQIGGKEKDFGKIGRVLAAFFAIACIGGSFGGGNMFQVNQAFDQFSKLPPISGTWIAGNGWFFGLIMAILVFIVIVGGVKSIARVTDKIVPAMVVIYVAAALVVIFGNISEIPAAFGKIFYGAFNNDALAGGFVGVLIQGFRRAAFSNEAGVGSASIAHSAVKTNYPASEGIVALMEPFIDTVVVCTMTALVIVVSGEYQNFTGDTSTAAGIALTSAAFQSVMTWFPYVLTIAVILFAFSTQITWAYYGTQAATYLFGKSKKVELIYKTIFCLFVIVGAAASLSNVTDFSDMMIFAMCFPNIFGLVFLAPVVKNELKKYREAIAAHDQ